jgi:hypothetical protein
VRREQCDIAVVVDDPVALRVLPVAARDVTTTAMGGSYGDGDDTMLTSITMMMLVGVMFGAAV